MGPDRSPAQLIAESDGLLLDFDGPVCDVYAGSDPAKIAAEVRAAFNLDIKTDDPLDLITYALRTDGPVDAIDQALADAELQAIGTSCETPGARRLIKSFDGPIAIASNNSTKAIETWLSNTSLRRHIAIVTGRQPRLMKPDPWPLRETVAGIDCRPDRCVFVGDSLSDAEASARAGIVFIALANKPEKYQAFSEAGCRTIIDDMAMLVPTLPGAI